MGVTEAQRDDDVDAVVIGSGFGGAVAADRLAECGVGSVLVLERGMPYPPLSFPRTPFEMRTNVWAQERGLHGLFEILRFRKVTAVLASGLGGGSLIYANVILPKPPETFEAEGSNGWRPWPITPADLAPGYSAVKHMLAPTPLPYGGWHVPKAPRIEQALDAIGAAPERAPVAITFAPRSGAPPQPGMPILTQNGQVDTDNLHHRPRHTCTLVGECDFGCNEGAKNSLDFNYLSRFLRSGNDRRIWTCCRAMRITGPLRGGGYDVEYETIPAATAIVRRRADEEGHPTDRDLLPPRAEEPSRRVVRARIVILAAGTFGTTRLLLASRTGLPPLSGQLGRRFSSNGDLLMFARHCREPDGKPSNLAPSRGPVITHYGTRSDDGHHTWVEDGGYPRGMEMMWQLTEAPRDLWNMRSVALRWLRGRLEGELGPEITQALGTAEASAAMVPLLAMGNDVPGGRIQLDGERLTLDWNPDGESNGYFTFIERQLAEVAGALRGRPAGTRLTRRLLPSRGLTAHPLGGCPMGTTEGEGVVKPTGEVWNCDGLYVADGSAMPGPVGPNPSFTIAAFAHRVAGFACERLRGLREES